MIYSRLKSQADSKGKHLYSFLKVLDSNKAYYRDFILQLANFSQLQNILSSPESLREVMDYLFKELPSAIIESYGARLASFVYKITTDDNFIYQKEFQEYLRKLYDQTDGLNRHFIAAVLTVYKDKFDFLDANDISTIGIRHGIDDADTYIDYRQLFNDSRLLVHIVFADQDAVEGHHDAALRFFQGQDPAYPGIDSYKKVASLENQTVLDKGNIRLALINILKEEYDINEHIANVGMVISRSHDGGVLNVFRPQQSPIDCEGKIFFLSACRTLTLTGELSSYYLNPSFINVDGTSYGSVTNIITYYLLEAFNRRISNFKEVEEFVKARVGTSIEDYIFPDNDALKVQRNIEDFLSRKLSSLMTGMTSSPLSWQFDRQVSLSHTLIKL